MADGKCVICGEDATHFGGSKTLLQFCEAHATEDDNLLEVPRPVSFKPEQWYCHECKNKFSFTEWLVLGGHMHEGVYKHPCPSVGFAKVELFEAPPGDAG